MKAKRLLSSMVLAIGLVTLMATPTIAKEFLLFDRPLNLFGYVTQGFAVNLKGDNYFTEQGLQSALMNVLMEGDYGLKEDLTLYTSALLTVDWIYDIKHDDNSWENKRFDKSRNNLYFDDEYWQILKETHITWAPSDPDLGTLFFRLGKQIVSWGEMDVNRIMDQINPLDESRGIADVEFENTIIPIWLLRAEYFLPPVLPLFQDLGIQFVFNPNADFIPNRRLDAGNSEGGVWSPEVNIPLRFPFPLDNLYLGALRETIDEPDTWDSDEFEYGVRLQTIIRDQIITINYFYGRENAPVIRGAPPGLAFSRAYDGRIVFHPVYEGEYPRFRFVGVTATGDVKFIHIPFLGGVTPVYRLEVLYAFDSSFTRADETDWEKYDELRTGLGIDWKVKLRFIPQWSYFLISPQIFWNHISDYPGHGLSGVEDDTVSYSLYIETRYFNARLVPSLVWLHDVNSRSDYVRLQATYDYSHTWRFTLGLQLFNGRERAGVGLDVFENKDQIYFKISFKLG